LLYDDTYQCGAVIICSRYVMTAGHCSEQDTIEVGVHDKSNKAEFQTTRSIHHVKRSFRHPDYFEYPYPEYSKYDFAILELENPINFIPEVKAISLPSATDTHFDEDTVFVTSGWGRISSFEPPSNVLLSVSVPWVPQKICRENYQKQGFKVTNDMICAGDVENGQIDSCGGDSGGPLAWLDKKTKKIKLVGTVSWGYFCAKKSYPGVYAELAKVLDWIKEVTGDCNEMTCRGGNCMNEDDLVKDARDSFMHVTEH